jgi:hypothetical protein
MPERSPKAVSPKAEKFARAARGARNGGAAGDASGSVSGSVSGSAAGGAAGKSPEESPPRPRRARPGHPLFDLRWERSLRRLRGTLRGLWGEDRGAAALAAARDVAFAHWRVRGGAARALDLARDIDPEAAGAPGEVVCRARPERLEGGLAALPEMAPWLGALGVTVLDLGPALDPAEPRRPLAALGTVEELAAAAGALEAKGIALGLDLPGAGAAAAGPEGFIAALDAALGWANLGLGALGLGAAGPLGGAALAAAIRVAAPAVVPFVPGEAPPGGLALRPGAGAALWSGLAARDARLLARALPRLVPGAGGGWAAGLSAEEGIVWEVEEADAAGLAGVTAAGHRAFLAQFFGGGFPGAFARAAALPPDPGTGAPRSRGTAAALAGLGTDADAVDRLLLGRALLAGLGAVPLCALGEEVGLGPVRGPMDWGLARAALRQPASAAGRLWAGTRAILAARAAQPGLGPWVPVAVLEPGDAALLAVLRPAPGGALVIVANLAETERRLAPAALAALGGRAVEILTGEAVRPDRGGGLGVPPLACLWLSAG